MQTDNIILQKHPANAMFKDYIFMTIPLYGFSCFMNGIRPVILALVAIITAALCDRLISALRRLPHDKSEISSVAFSLIVVLMLPANISYYIAILTVLFTILIGKAAFGGYGFYVFSPPAVGFCIAAISWPNEVFSYSPVNYFLPLLEQSAMPTTLGVLSAVKTGGRPAISDLDLLLGNYPSAMGVGTVLIILALGAFLWMRKRISLSVTLTYILTCVVIAYVLPRTGNAQGMLWNDVSERLYSVSFELLAGVIIFIAIFMLNDEVTLPKRKDARIVYSALFGIITMFYSYTGFYEIGACFALICINSTAPIIDNIMSNIFKRVKIKVNIPSETEAST